MSELPVCCVSLFISIILFFIVNHSLLSCANMLVLRWFQNHREKSQENGTVFFVAAESKNE